MLFDNHMPLSLSRRYDYTKFSIIFEYLYALPLYKNKLKHLIICLKY